MGTKRKVTIQYEDSTSEEDPQSSSEDSPNESKSKKLSKKDFRVNKDESMEMSGCESDKLESDEEIDDVEQSDEEIEDVEQSNEEIEDVEQSNDDSDQEDDNESGNDGKSENSEDDGNNDGTTNLCWADAMSKILKINKPKGKKTLVLSKAKKLTDANRSKEPILKKKKKEHVTARIKPDILKRDHERMLSKIATKGVVQLFNAVRKQQKDIDVQLEEAGPLDTKREKVLKSLNKEEFLNVLMGDKNDIPTKKETKKSSEQTSNAEPTWSVLREDFMMGSKMKDWDKELEEDNEEETEYE